MRCQACSSEIPQGAYCNDCKRRLSLSHLNEAKSLLAFHNHQRALSECRQALEIDPQLQEARTLKEEIDTKINDFQRLISEAERASRRGDYQEAVESYQKAISINPTHSELRMKMDMAKAYISTGLPSRPKVAPKREPHQARQLDSVFVFDRNFFLVTAACIFFSCLGIYQLYVRSQKTERAKELFDKVSQDVATKYYYTKMNYYWGQDFVEDYEKLMSEHDGTEYAQMAEKTFLSKYKKAKKELMEDFVPPAEVLEESEDASAETPEGLEKRSLRQGAKLIERGEQLFERGRPEEAMQVWANARNEAHPEQREEIEAKMEKAKNIVETKRKEYETLVEKAQRLEREGDYIRAMETYGEALELNSEDKESIRRMDYIKKNHLSSPMKMFAENISFHTSKFFREIRQFYHRRKNKERIIALYTKKEAVLKKKKNYLALAKLYKKMQQSTQDETYREKAILALRIRKLIAEGKRESSEARLVQLASLYRALGYAGEYTEIYNAVRESENKGLFFYLLMVDHHRRKNNLPQAAKLYRKLLQRYPCVFLQYHLSVVMNKEDEGERGDLLKKAYETLPYQVAFCVALAQHYLVQENLESLDGILSIFENTKTSELYALQRFDPFSLKETFDLTAQEEIFEGQMNEIISLYFKTGRVSAALRAIAALQNL